MICYYGWDSWILFRWKECLRRLNRLFFNALLYKVRRYLHLYINQSTKSKMLQLFHSLEIIRNIDQYSINEIAHKSKKFQLFISLSAVVLCVLLLLSPPYKPKKATHSSKPEEDYVKNDLNFPFNSFPCSRGDKALVTQLGGLLFRARVLSVAPGACNNCFYDSQPASTIVAR